MWGTAEGGNSQPLVRKPFGRPQADRPGVVFAGHGPISETVYSVSGIVCWQIYPLSKMDNSGPTNHATCPILLGIKWLLVTNTIKTGENLYIFTLSKRLNL